MGAGREAVFIIGSTGAATIDIDTASDILLTGFNVSNTGSASTDDVIYSNYFNPMYRHYYYNIHISGGDDGIYLQNVRNSVVANNIIESTGTEGMYLYATTNDNIVAQNIVRNTGTDGITFANSNRSQLIDNNVYNAGDEGIRIESSDNNIVANNVIDTTNGNGMTLSQSDFVTVSGNSIYNAGVTAGSDGLVLSTVNDTTVTGNIINNPLDDGIATGSSAYRLNILGNSIYSAGSDGISLGTINSANVTIANNSISSSAAYGINIGSFKPTELLIANNNFTGNTSGSINGATQSQTTMLSNNIGQYSTDLNNITIFPVTTTTFTNDIFEIRMDGADADSFQGNAFRVVVDQSQNTGNIFLAEDDASARLFSIDETGKIFTNAGIGIGTTSPDASLHVVGGDTYIAPDSGYTFDNPSGNEDLYVYGNLEVDGSTYLSSLYLGGTQLTSTATELNYLDGTTVTNGGVIFGNGTYLTQDTANFFWDDSSNELGIGTTAPSQMLDIFGTSAGLQLSYDTSNYGRFSIGSDGTLTLAGVSAGGSLTNIARFSTSQVNFDVPTAFNAAGDVSIAYDLYFTNQTASYIKSDGPLTIQSGETFENNDLTLETYGTGDIILKARGGNLWADGSSVGIGTTSPLSKFDVLGAVSIGTYAGTKAAPSNGMIISGNVGIASTNPGSNTLKVVGSLCVKSTDAACAGSTAGTIYATTTTVASADYAEYFATKDTDLTSGEAVCVDTENANSVKRCTRSQDTNIMGIVSTNPGVLGNSTDETIGNKNYTIVAMLGQIPARVSNENGAVKIGDSLTSSSIPGYVMKANPGDSTVGVALENLDPSVEKGSIQVMISRKNKSLTVEVVEAQVTQHIADMKIEDEVNALVKSAVDAFQTQPLLSIDATGNIIITGQSEQIDVFTKSQQAQTLSQRVSELEISATNTDTRLNAIEDRLSALEQASASASLETLNDRVGFLEQLFTGMQASGSADLSTYLARLIDGQVLGLNSDEATASALTVTGDTNLNNLAVTGEISSGLLTINGFDDSLATPAATISTLGGSLKLQHLGLGEIEFMAGKSRIDTDGNFIISEGDLVIETGVIKGNDQIRGIDVPVASGKTSVEVIFDTVKDTDTYAVNITPTWLTNIAVTEKRTDGFVIKFSTPAPLDAKLDWVVIE